MYLMFSNRKRSLARGTREEREGKSAKGGRGGNSQEPLEKVKGLAVKGGKVREGNKGNFDFINSY